jgi:hypothetical protein
MNFERGVTGMPWTDDEVNLVIDEYFRLYEAISSGQHPIKSHIYRELSRRLEVRTEASVEYKMMNISAVLVRLGWPALPGMGPMPNIQKSLGPAVETALRHRMDILDPIASEIVSEPELNGPVDLVLSASSSFSSKLKVEASYLDRSPVKRDYLELEARNRTLGLAGEKSVVHFERQRLKQAGRSDLAREVRHVSVTDGDGLGYDISSFDLKGRRRLLEVKTTRGGRNVPFFLTPRELEVSLERPDEYVLVRLFEFPRRKTRKKAPFFEASGAVSARFVLEPDSYRAVEIIS